MSAPALIRQGDAKRLLAGARDAGFTCCELTVAKDGGLRLVAKMAEPEPPASASEAWSDDDR